MVFNTNFNNISVISLGYDLSVEETGLPGEYHWQTWSHNGVSVHSTSDGQQFHQYQQNYYVNCYNILN